MQLKRKHHMKDNDPDWFSDQLPPPTPKREKKTYPPGRVVFRPWRIDPKTGQKLWAKNYGFKAWPIPVSEITDGLN